jgi:hypothetical protein
MFPEADERSIDGEINQLSGFNGPAELVQEAELATKPSPFPVAKSMAVQLSPSPSESVAVNCPKSPEEKSSEK